MTSRNRSSKSGGNRASRFTIEFAGNDYIKCQVKAKLNQVRDTLSQTKGPTSNTDAINAALDCFMNQNTTAATSTTATNTLITLSEEQVVSEKTQLITETSLRQLVEMVNSHGYCGGDLQVDVSPTAYRGFAQKMTLFCRRKCSQFKKDKGKVVWNSPRDKSGNFVINTKLLHAFYSTGMLPIHFRRLFTAADITVKETYIKTTPLSKQYLAAVTDVSTVLPSQPNLVIICGMPVLTLHYHKAIA